MKIYVTVSFSGGLEYTFGRGKDKYILEAGEDGKLEIEKAIEQLREQATYKYSYLYYTSKPFPCRKDEEEDVLEEYHTPNPIITVNGINTELWEEEHGDIFMIYDGDVISIRAVCIIIMVKVKFRAALKKIHDVLVTDKCILKAETSKRGVTMYELMDYLGFEEVIDDEDLQDLVVDQNTDMVQPGISVKVNDKIVSTRKTKQFQHYPLKDGDLITFFKYKQRGQK